MFIQEIYRDGDEVKIVINLNLGTEVDVVEFLECFNTEQEAELYTRHLREELEKAREEIAVNPAYWLSGHKLDRVKRMMSRWNIKKQEWV